MLLGPPVLPHPAGGETLSLVPLLAPLAVVAVSGEASEPAPPVDPPAGYATPGCLVDPPPPPPIAANGPGPKTLLVPWFPAVAEPGALAPPAPTVTVYG